MDSSRTITRAARLSWLWKHNLHATIDFVKDYTLINDLGYFAVVESLDDLVQQWLLLDLGPGIDRESAEYDVRWRGSLARSLVKADLDIGKPMRCPDAAINRVVNDLSQIRQTLWRLDKDGKGRGSMSLFPSIQLIVTCITRPDGHQQIRDSQFYDEFKALATRISNKMGGQVTLGVQALDLWHPVNPDPDSFYTGLRLMKEAGKEPYVIGGQRSVVAGRIHSHCLERAIALLEKHDRRDDAQWMQNALQKLREDLSGHYYSELDRGVFGRTEKVYRGAILDREASLLGAERPPSGR